MPPAAEAPLVALVDDDELYRETVTANLEEAGFRCLGFADGEAVLAWYGSAALPDAFLLDWQMPNMDGPAVLARLRQQGCTAPALFLTGLGQPIYEEKGLALGAVDFIDKGKSFGILLRRLNIALASKGGALPAEAASGGLRLDPASARADWNGQRVELTLGEFRVVQLLAQRMGRDVTYRDIYDAVRGEGFEAGRGPDGFRANVRAMVKRIRQKFRDVDADFDAIEVYPGFGYRWRDGA